jgi:hypothetical protein
VPRWVTRGFCFPPLLHHSITPFSELEPRVNEAPIEQEFAELLPKLIEPADLTKRPNKLGEALRINGSSAESHYNLGHLLAGIIMAFR